MEKSIDRDLAWERYVEICNDIRTTDDISFKILGLVPFISGAALVTILDAHRLSASALIYVSVVGVVLTFGFYRWELRNIQTCQWLIDRAADIEKAALGLFGSEAKPAGQFYGAPLSPRLLRWLHRPGHPRRPIRVGKKGAEHIIYLATMLAWLALPVVASISS